VEIEIVLRDVLLPDSRHHNDLLEEFETIVPGLGRRQFDDLYFLSYPEFLEKPRLVSLIHKPRVNLTRFHGVFA
jgi:hypothetical protein